MSHQPFESWLFSDEVLEPDKTEALETHLNQCKQCSQISESLNEVVISIAQSQTPEPKPGFTERWYQNLSVYREKQQERKIWLIILGLFALSCIILLSLFLFNLTNRNWSYELGQFAVSVSQFAITTRRIFNIARSLTEAFPIIIPMMIVFSIGLFSVFVTLIITWFSSIIRLYKPVEEGIYLP